MAELALWMEEKELTVAEDACSGPSNILRKLMQHAVAESELRASHGHVEHLQQVGKELSGSQPQAREDIQARLQGLSSQWEELNHKTAQRWDQLQQARWQDQLLRLLQEAKEKMEQLEGAQQDAEARQDPGSSRWLQRRLCQLEAEGQMLADKMAALCSQAHGAGTSQSILDETQRCLQRFQSLQGHLAAQRLQLQASAELCQFYQLSQAELSWVAEHMPSAGPSSPTKCWDSVQSLYHKHKVAPLPLRASLTSHSQTLGTLCCRSGCPGFQISAPKGLAVVWAWSSVSSFALDAPPHRGQGAAAVLLLCAGATGRAESSPGAGAAGAVFRTEPGSLGAPQRPALRRAVPEAGRPLGGAATGVRDAGVEAAAGRGRPAVLSGSVGAGGVAGREAAAGEQRGLRCRRGRDLEAH